MEQQEEAGTSRGARRWEFWHFSATEATVLVSFGSSASSLLPPEGTHNNHVTGAISPRPEKLHWDSARLPCSPMVTFSKLHLFCTKLFAE